MRSFVLLLLLLGLASAQKPTTLFSTPLTGCSSCYGLGVAACSAPGTFVATDAGGTVYSFSVDLERSGGKQNFHKIVGSNIIYTTTTLASNQLISVQYQPYTAPIMLYVIDCIYGTTEKMQIPNTNLYGGVPYHFEDANYNVYLAIPSVLVGQTTPNLLVVNITASLESGTVQTAYLQRNVHVTATTNIGAPTSIAYDPTTNVLVYIDTFKSVMTAVDFSSQRVLWNTQSVQQAPMTTFNGTLYFSRSPDLLAIDLLTGVVLANSGKLPIRATTFVGPMGSTLVNYDRGFAELDSIVISDDSVDLVWSLGSIYPQSNTVAIGSKTVSGWDSNSPSDYLVYAGDPSNLYAIDLDTGLTVWSLPDQNVFETSAIPGYVAVTYTSNGFMLSVYSSGY